ncbi:MAG: gamma-glutamyl-phosphate reductase, partial [Caldilinea sp.]
MSLERMGEAARAASRRLATVRSAAKNRALSNIADKLEARMEAILAANEQDRVAAQAKGLSPALLDRLLLNEARVRALAADARKVAALPDPVGAELENRLLPNGMRLSRRRIPIG